MQPPKISNRFRRKAGEKAVAARRDRAKTKELVASGELFFLELFEDDRKSIARMKLIDLLQSVPGVGKIRAEQILERASISPSRRIGGVGPRQIELLRKEFLLMKNSPRAGKLLVVSGPSGVGKSTITNNLRNDDRFWISISVTTRKIRPGEVDGTDYHFVNDDEFDQMIKAHKGQASGADSKIEGGDHNRLPRMPASYYGKTFPSQCHDTQGHNRRE